MTSEATRQFTKDVSFVLAFLEQLQALGKYDTLNEVSGAGISRMAEEAQEKMFSLDALAKGQRPPRKNNVIQLKESVSHD